MLRLNKRFVRCGVAALGLLGVVVVGADLGGVALGQDNSIAPGDVILARKGLMEAIGNSMDALEAIVTASKVDLAEGSDHADTISVMLLSFPHLFPPSTNQWKPNAQRDPGRDTFAAPEVWTNYADFYKRADAASKVAFDVSRSDDAEALKKYTAALRSACDSCHAIYMK